MWTAIKAGAKAFFGSPVAKDGLEIVKGVGQFIDEQKFTEQEKAEYVKEMAPVYAAWMKSTVNENSERSRTRRHLAILIIRNWVGMLWASILVWLWKPDYAQFILTIALSTALITLVLGIGAFFWGTHLLRTTKLSKE